MQLRININDGYPQNVNRERDMKEKKNEKEKKKSVYFNYAIYEENYC